MSYVHGYSSREAERLHEQATSVQELLHADLSYGTGRRVLEAGCGTGEQTLVLAANSPEARIVSVDLSNESLEIAKGRVASAGYRNVEFMRADLFALPFENASFDDLFVCFVLEHLREPLAALRELRRFVRPGYGHGVRRRSRLLVLSSAD